MNSAAIRQSFVDFFVSKGHTHVASSSLVPRHDPTLLFTNAGMVQFKRVFQGLEKRNYARAVSVQKCVRAGGKHNDLEQVGHTARHHTFFEMLGNFSFGDYFKRDAIEYAWEWVTGREHLGIEPSRLYVSVHHTDHEARGLWRKVTGIADARIYGLGDADNFWQMGNTGPCGPCSELYVDIRPAPERSNRPPPLDEFMELNENGLLLEIWNLVFMQFDQASDGTRRSLPAPSVDTGAGLERIAAVMQGVPSNFDTDLFMGVIERAVEVVGVPYDRGPAGVGFRVMADHARAAAFLIVDGVSPTNQGRGYVLRRILRRAVRHAYLLGRREATLVHLTEAVVEKMGDVFPELRDRAHEIARATRGEEQRFFGTIEAGLKRLDDLIHGSVGTVPGAEAFKLYDTYGFPLDLTQVIASERGWSVDHAGFEQALKRQQKRSHDAGRKGRDAHRAPLMRARGSRKFTRLKPRVRQRFVGYESTKAETEVLAFRQTDDQLELMLHEDPFYAESGGQVSDTGIVRGEGWELPIEDVVKLEGKQVVVGPFSGPFEPTGVSAEVDEERRRDIERNHTATHLVHAALRNVLGEHVRQSGSVVDPARLRFDFSHHAPVRDAELRAIEEEVNKAIWRNVDVETRRMAYDDARAAGAMALFGEKYGDVVRVVDIPGISLELCGGTHVRTTGQIGLFQFSGEAGVAAGVRRVEALTGPGAYAFVKVLDGQVEEVAETLRTTPQHAARKIESLLQEKRRLEKQIEGLLHGGDGGKSAHTEEHKIGNATLLVEQSAIEDRNQIGLLMDAFRAKHHGSIRVILASGERPGIHVAVTDDLVSQGVRAGEIVKMLAAATGGSGGGRPHFASGGVGDPSKLSELRSKTPGIVAAVISSELN